MNDHTKAVFLSYASEDREAAFRIGQALQLAGLEVWFDKAELRGGDVWDAKIRGQIKSCALFLPIISNNTRARHEGYFRLEWKLAVDRSYLMSQAKAFLVPVAIDGTGEEHDSVPDRFREVQWSRLPGGVPTSDFIDRLKHLLTQPVLTQSTSSSLTSPSVLGLQGSAARRAFLWRRIGLGIVFIAALSFAAYRYMPIFQKGTTPEAVKLDPAPTGPSQNSVAVMPFSNLSGDASQEYFSDGLSEEMRTSLARIAGLQVASRSSSASFKGKSGTAGEIGEKLHVAALLEGSVRRDGTKVRISVQLVDAMSGFEVWSQSYDRELKDILALQAEIATAVAQGLKVKLVDHIATVIETGGTSNPQAFDLYLRAQQLYRKPDQQSQQDALTLCSEAIRLDPAYAKAYALRSQVEFNLAGSYDPLDRIASRFADSRRDIEHAIELTPGDALLHSIYGNMLAEAYLDFDAARRELDQAQELAPDRVDLIAGRAKFEGYMGHRSEVVRLTQRILQLNSPNATAYYNGSLGLGAVGLYEESLKFADRATLLLGTSVAIEARCTALSELKRDGEVIAACSKVAAPQVQTLVVIALSRLKRTQEADALLQTIVKENGDAAAYQYALIESQRGNTAVALKWLEKAYELRDGGLIDTKQDPLVDPIRQEPRFKAVLEKLKFPP